MAFTAAALNFSLALILSVARLCLLALFAVAEPIVRTALGGIALLSAGTACFFACFTQLPDFPFVGMLALSVVCILVLIAYYRVMRLLSDG
ncbi:MAG: hypothetical protein ACREXP_22495 [Steroidobacteraceae bacterium]